MKMRARTVAGVGSFLLTLSCFFGGCGDASSVTLVPEAVGQSLREVALGEARTCHGPSDYPQALVDGLSRQLVAEIRCLDPRWLEFYESCEEPGCLTANGPQLQAGRPELLDALKEIAQEKQENIRLNAAYRDVGMQYFSWWKRAFCDSSFMAAEPGASNHQGGRAVDVHFHGYWREALKSSGFSNDVPNDLPHFDLVGDATFRTESEELRTLSVRAFQILWNRNHPEDLIGEDGLYGPETATRLGSSPIAGFAKECLDPCLTQGCMSGCDLSLCNAWCEANPCGEGCASSGCGSFCALSPCDASCDGAGCEDPLAICAADPCAAPCPISGCAEWGRDCDATNCFGDCVDNVCVFPEDVPPTRLPGEPNNEGPFGCNASTSATGQSSLLWIAGSLLCLRARRRRVAGGGLG